MWGRATDAFVRCAYVFTLVACGEASHVDSRPVGGAGSGAAAGAADDSSSAGDAGAPPDPPRIDVSGRWGLFNFEDPVGVQLFQDRDGKLTGTGCDIGAPPFAPDADPVPCGSIQGEVHGQRVRFSFGLPSVTPPTSFFAETTLAADGKRMTGTFGGVYGSLEFPSAWLPIADGENYLPVSGPGEASEALDPASYDLVLSAPSNGSEYTADKTYRFVYYVHGVGGDLGAFWPTEITRPTPEGPVQVGPVPTTVPELPVYLTMQHAGTRITTIDAVTGSGHAYTFTATPH